MQGRNIQPISFWFQGVTTQANSIFCQVILDDNYSCKIEYRLQNETTVNSENQITVLQTGNKTITGSDYISYNSSPNGNDYMYTWTAQKLGLTLIP